MWSGGRRKEGECHSDSCRAAVERLSEWTVDTGPSLLCPWLSGHGRRPQSHQGLFSPTRLCTQLFFHPDCTVVKLYFTRTEDHKQHVRIKDAGGGRVM